jgi:hypothetical protein
LVPPAQPRHGQPLLRHACRSAHAPVSPTPVRPTAHSRLRHHPQPFRPSPRRTRKLHRTPHQSASPPPLLRLPPGSRPPERVRHRPPQYPKRSKHLRSCLLQLTSEFIPVSSDRKHANCFNSFRSAATVLTSHGRGVHPQPSTRRSNRCGAVYVSDDAFHNLSATSLRR